MARMHSKKKGKSSSKHPSSKTTPGWCQYSKEEVVEIILQMAKEAKPASEIGIVLRDQHGIPSVKNICGKSVSQIITDAKLAPEYPEDLLNLMRKAVRLMKHLEKNKKDLNNLRALRLTESKIRRLADYYRKNKRLSKDWHYKPEQAALITKA